MGVTCHLKNVFVVFFAFKLFIAHIYSVMVIDTLNSDT